MNELYCNLYYLACMFYMSGMWCICGTMEDSFKVAATRIQEYYIEKDPSILEDSAIDIEYDGSWHRRGFSGHYSIRVIIELTGLVLDVHIMRNHHRFIVRFPIGLDIPLITLPFHEC